MRIRDCTRLYADHVIRVPHNASVPRHFKCSLLQTKNDIEGTGRESGLISFLPCTCLSVLSPKERLRFAQRLVADPMMRCPVLIRWGLFLYIFFIFVLNSIC